jgi:hypothetical protein
MFMRCPMFKRIYSFSAAGGGVPGKAAGTAHITMTEGGVITEAYRLFTGIFLRVGEIITEIINGKGISGNISGCLTRISNAIGKAGKKTGIGNRKHGVCKDCLPEISREISGLASLNKVPSQVDKDVATIREKENRKDMEDRAAKRQLVT